MTSNRDYIGSSVDKHKKRGVQVMDAPFRIKIAYLMAKAATST
jgi:hypothetical protein